MNIEKIAKALQLMGYEVNESVVSCSAYLAGEGSVYTNSVTFFQLRDGGILACPNIAGFSVPAFDVLKVEASMNGASVDIDFIAEERGAKHAPPKLIVSGPWKTKDGMTNEKLLEELKALLADE